MGYPDKILIQLMQGLCIPVEMGKVIENAGNLGEVWMFLEKHFNIQMNLIDGLLSQLLRMERMELLLMVMPKREANHWRMDQLNAAVDELPAAFQSNIDWAFTLSNASSHAQGVMVTPRILKDSGKKVDLFGLNLMSNIL